MAGARGCEMERAFREGVCGCSADRKWGRMTLRHTPSYKIVLTTHAEQERWDRESERGGGNKKRAGGGGVDETSTSVAATRTATPAQNTRSDTWTCQQAYLVHYVLSSRSSSSIFGVVGGAATCPRAEQTHDPHNTIKQAIRQGNGA